VGKIPKRALAASRSGDEANRLSAFLGDQKARAERLSGLRRQLEQAVAAEQYERAASLRDEIRRTTTIDPSAGLPDAGLPGTGPSEGSPS
jgi:protein-arginine kinase activator protein McsA